MNLFFVQKVTFYLVLGFYYSPNPSDWFDAYFWLDCIIIDCFYDEMYTLLAFILKWFLLNLLLRISGELNSTIHLKKESRN